MTQDGGRAPGRLLRLALVAEDVAGRAGLAVLGRLGWRQPIVVPFVGYGSPDRVRVGARVVVGNRAATPAAPASPTPAAAATRWTTARAAVRRFLTAELPRAPVVVQVADRSAEVCADREGYVDAVLDLPGLPAGWHEVRFAVRHRGRTGTAAGQALLIDPAAPLGVISDVDDTVIETGINRGLAMLRTTLLTDVADRTPLPGAAALYRALVAGPPGGPAPPMFYLSTSPWNLHEVLVDFLTLRGFPLGPLLLTDWGPSHAGLFRIGSMPHKLGRIRRLLAEHPRLRVVLIGDSGQHDPEIYAAVATEQPGRVRAIYIRRTSPLRPDRRAAVEELAARISAAGVPMLVVTDSVRIAEHAAGLGLLDRAAVATVRAAVDHGELPGSRTG